MISGLLIFLIALCSLKYYEQERRSVLIFAAICGFFQFFHNEIYYLVGFKYYLGAAFADLLIIQFLSKVSNPTKAICALQRACFIFININLFGWVAYELYYESIIYDLLCQALFVAILIASINTRKKDGLGDIKIHRNSSLIFGGNPSRSFKMQDNKATKRS